MKTTISRWGKLAISSDTYSDYRIYDAGETLGEGRYANVYEGKNINTGQEVVMKYLKPIKWFKI